jgi:hypothetical protein
MPNSQTRVVGSGFSVMRWNGQKIAFLETVQDNGQSPVNTVTPVQPLDEPYPIEFAVPRAMNAGTLSFSIRELWDRPVWAAPRRSGDRQRPPGRLVGHVPDAGHGHLPDDHQASPGELLAAEDVPQRGHHRHRRLRDACHRLDDGGEDDRLLLHPTPPDPPSAQAPDPNPWRDNMQFGDAGGSDASPATGGVLPPPAISSEKWTSPPPAQRRRAPLRPMRGPLRARHQEVTKKSLPPSSTRVTARSSRACCTSVRSPTSSHGLGTASRSGR